MTETVRQKATADLKMIEDVTAVVLPEPSTELVPLARAREAGRRRDQEADG